MVRFFMNYFIKRPYNLNEIKVISHFLKEKGLTRAERHAIIYSLGFKYQASNNCQLRHLQINGYLNHPPRGGK